MSQTEMVLRLYMLGLMGAVVNGIYIVAVDEARRSRWADLYRMSTVGIGVCSILGILRTPQGHAWQWFVPTGFALSWTGLFLALRMKPSHRTSFAGRSNEAAAVTEETPVWVYALLACAMASHAFGLAVICLPEKGSRLFVGFAALVVGIALIEFSTSRLRRGEARRSGDDVEKAVTLGKSQHDAVLFIGVGVFFMLASSWMASSVRQRVHAVKTRFLSTPGTLVESEIIKVRRRERAAIRYRYTVEGKEYENGDFAPLKSKATASWVRSHPPGVAVAVHYDPSDPCDSFLLRTPRRSNLRQAVAAFLLGVCFGMFAVWHGLRVHSLRIDLAERKYRLDKGFLWSPESAGGDLADIESIRISQVGRRCIGALCMGAGGEFRIPRLSHGDRESREELTAMAQELHLPLVDSTPESGDVVEPSERPSPQESGEHKPNGDLPHDGQPPARDDAGDVTRLGMTRRARAAHVVLAAVCLSVALKRLPLLLRIHQVKTQFRSTSGIIMDSKGPSGRRRGRATVRYRYTVEGTEHENTVIAPWELTKEESWIRRHPSGTTVPVHYSPSDPRDSYLLRSPKGTDLVLLVPVMAFMGALGACLAAHGLRTDSLVIDLAGLRYRADEGFVWRSESVGGDLADLRSIRVRRAGPWVTVQLRLTSGRELKLRLPRVSGRQHDVRTTIVCFAQTLGLPLIDAAAGSEILASPSKHDLPLRERVREEREGVVHDEELPEPPSRLTIRCREEGQERHFVLPPRAGLGSRIFVTAGILVLYGMVLVLAAIMPPVEVVCIALSPALALIAFGLVLAHRGIGLKVSACFLVGQFWLASRSAAAASPFAHAAPMALGLLVFVLFMIFISLREHITASSARLELSFRLMGAARRKRTVACGAIKDIKAEEASGNPSIILMDFSQIKIARHTCAAPDEKRWLAEMLRWAVTA